MRHEGVHASYIGRRFGVGDRCLVLSDEGEFSHVRWVTGSVSGDYNAVPNRDLALDTDLEDSFGFEVAAPRRVVVSCREVLDGAGVGGLINALNQNGYMAMTTSRAEGMVASLRQAINNDPLWQEVFSSVGDDHPDVLAAVLSSAFTSAITRSATELEDDDDCI